MYECNLYQFVDPDDKSSMTSWGRDYVKNIK